MQLAESKHELEELQSIGADIVDVKRAETRVLNFDMTLET